MSTPQSNFCGRSYAIFVKVASLLQSPVLLVIRLYWGWTFMTGGWGKLTNLSKISDYFASLHIPVPYVNAVLAGSAECFGGAMLLIGLASRLAALPLIFTMIIAYATAESDNLKVIFSDPDKFTGAAPFLFLYASVIVLAFGPGVFSVDWILGKVFSKRTSTPPTA